MIERLPSVVFPAYCAFFRNRPTLSTKSLKTEVPGLSKEEPAFA